MGPLTLFKISPWAYLLLLLPIVKLSHQNVNEDTLQRLENIIVEKFADIDKKLSNMDARLSQMDNKIQEIDNQICGLNKLLNNSGMESNQIAEEKILLTFNPTEVMLYVGQETRLDCGVIGMFSSCHWEHGGVIYQLADVKNASHSLLKAASNSMNQCGIVITSVRTSHEGLWTCNVFTLGETLTASKNVSIGCPGGFFKSNGSEQCFKIFRDQQRNWDEARAKCDSEGLRLAEPSDAVGVSLRKDIFDTYGDGNVWLGARGDDNDFLWLSNRARMRSDHPLYENGPYDFLTDSNCLQLEAHRWRGNPERPYDFHSCWVADSYALCEVIMQQPARLVQDWWDS